jgi:hypothetical protein
MKPPTNIMLKTVVWTGLLLHFILSVSSCGDGSSNQKDTESDSDDTPSDKDTESDSGDTPSDSEAAFGPAGTITVSIDDPTPIGEMAFGLNYWSWVDAWGNNVAGTSDTISKLSPRLIRIGGHNNDANEPEPFDNAELDEAIAYVRSMGAEPLVQVPMLADVDGETPTPETAAEMVTYLNVTNDYGVKYFSIGNEPDLYGEQGDMPSDYTADMFSETYLAFAKAMKAVDSDILLVGPDLSWKYKSGDNDWLTPFLETCGDMVDIVAIHRYPLDPAQTTIARALDDAEELRTLIDSIRDKMASAGMVDAPLAITEANITWDGDPVKSTLDASPGTFYAGLWAADTLGTAFEEGLFSYMFWSISEGWTLGILDGKSPRPVYYMIKMYADHFGSNTVETTVSAKGFSVYAGRTDSDDGTVLMVLNKNALQSEQTIGINGGGVDVETVHVFPAYSISAVTVTDKGDVSVTTFDEAHQDEGPIESL